MNSSLNKCPACSIANEQSITLVANDKRTAIEPLRVELHHHYGKWYINGSSRYESTEQMCINFCPVCGRELTSEKISKTVFITFMSETYAAKPCLVSDTINFVCKQNMSPEEKYEALYQLLRSTGITLQTIERLDLNS